jgi:hypothetical protein
MKSANIFGQLEHAMVAAHGIPVRVVWSFTSSRIECVRVDAQELTSSMERTFAHLVQEAAKRERGVAKWRN